MKKPVAIRTYSLDSERIFWTFQLHTNPFLQNKKLILCSIASSHEDLHEVTSISLCAELNSQSVFPSTVSQGMELCLEFRSTRMVHSHQKIRPPNFKLTGCRLFINQFMKQWTDPSQSSDQIWHPLRISKRIFHPSSRSEPILHPSRPSDHFSKFPLRKPWDMSNSQPIPASSPRYHSNNSPM